MPITTQDDTHNAELDQVLREYVDVAERLARTHQTLEDEIKRLRGELRRKDRELEQRKRLAALGEMAAGVAHEVRNPLGAIQLCSNLLRKECGGIAPALKLISTIESGIASIEGVVQSTLALAPSREHRFRVCPLREVLERAVDLSAETFRRRGVRLDLKLPPDSVLLHCDIDALHRAVLNLLVNAAEASPTNSAVSVAIEARKRIVRVHVRDQGPGLSDEVRERVFDPFFTTKEQGTGLGLSISHRLVEAHGGKLSVRNRPAGGAEFSITLPTADAAGAQRARDDPTEFLGVA